MQPRLQMSGASCLTEADIVNDKLAHYKDMEHSEQAWENEYIHEVTCPKMAEKSILVRPGYAK